MDIFEAIKNEDNQRVIQLLDEGVDVDIRFENGSTPLMFAAQNGNLEIVKLLLERGANVNAKNEIGSTVLMFADQSNNLEIIQLLLGKGANINAEDNNGLNALHYAARYSNSLEIVKLLLESGVNVNAKSKKGNTPLMLAGRNENENYLNIVKLLLDNGANPFDDIKCLNELCNDLINEYRWKRLYQRDIDTASRYSKRTTLPKDIWTLILLNKRQQQLCEKLSSDKNKEILVFFALEMGISITDNMTKGQLCGLISRQLAYGKYSEKAQRDINVFKQDILAMAHKLNIDINRPIDEIVKDLARIF